jgi:2-dehydro-3-deoxyphosphogalactonate aldolase
MAVLPKHVPLIPVGGITPDSLAGYAAAGARGFGIGSALYRPRMPAKELSARATAFVDAWDKVKAPQQTGAQSSRK